MLAVVYSVLALEKEWLLISLIRSERNVLPWNRWYSFIHASYLIDSLWINCGVFLWVIRWIPHICFLSNRDIIIDVVWMLLHGLLHDPLDLWQSSFLLLHFYSIGFIIGGAKLAAFGQDRGTSWLHGTWDQWSCRVSPVEEVASVFEQLSILFTLLYHSLLIELVVLWGIQLAFQKHILRGLWSISGTQMLEDLLIFDLLLGLIGLEGENLLGVVSIVLDSSVYDVCLWIDFWFWSSCSTFSIDSSVRVWRKLWSFSGPIEISCV